MFFGNAFRFLAEEHGAYSKILSPPPAIDSDSDAVVTPDAGGTPAVPVRSQWHESSVNSACRPEEPRRLHGTSRSAHSSC